MATKTVLQIVQSVLASMNGDNVNDINSTREAANVAQIAEDVFNEMIAGREWPHLRKVIALDAVSATYPNYMQITSVSASKVNWIRYDKRTAAGNAPLYTDIIYCTPKNFLVHVMSRDPADSNVQNVTDYDGKVLYIKNDVGPTYWTSFDDQYIVFDSFDSDVDSFLAGNKSLAEVYTIPTFTKSNSHVPDLPDQAFPEYLAEVKSVASYELRQVANEKAEQQSNRQRARNHRKGNRHQRELRYPDYGRS